MLAGRHLSRHFKNNARSYLLARIHTPGNRVGEVQSCNRCGQQDSLQVQNSSFGRERQSASFVQVRVSGSKK